jgi:hypothetical protein
LRRAKKGLFENAGLWKGTLNELVRKSLSSPTNVAKIGASQIIGRGVC